MHFQTRFTGRGETSQIITVEHGNDLAAPRPAPVQCFDCLYTSKRQDCPEFSFEEMRNCSGASLGSSISTGDEMDHGMRCGRVARSFANEPACHLSAEQLNASQHGCVAEGQSRCVVPGKAGWRVSQGVLSEFRNKTLDLLHTRLRCAVDGRCE